MNNPLGVSPSKGNQGTTRGKEKLFNLHFGVNSLFHHLLKNIFLSQDFEPF